MKRAMAGLALGMLLCSPVIAATSIDTPAFTITYIDGPQPEDWSITQVSLFPDTYSFSLDTLNQHLDRAEAQDFTGAGAFAERSSWSALRLDIDAGYRVSRVMLTGIAFGELSPGQLPDFPPGFVHNEASLFLTVPSAPTESSLNGDFQAENIIELSTIPLNLTGTVELGISGNLLVQAWGVEGGGAFADSLAAASLRDLVLHVEVSAIPEPATYAMLLGGLGLLAVAGRYKKQ
ncbi:PEP-CTERM sorting domain-containing protein [Pseudoduganella albidiflava]|uniref:PEP-CTERM sorting domain-containing protein n=2 Tax=Pseudoduganella albidiflava TaxID=321983 RepID=A0ABX5RV06_9BURK|nr:PEP-CTERM sorting domain-containing protein [Pseudoduganella albidiflava]QBI02473.1 PEP-CTERM sorting domain-containing protein [Pseudoduganella albidiflava]